MFFLFRPATQPQFEVGDASATAPRSPVQAITGLLPAFIYLQILDLLTTLTGFRVGAAEASPFIRILMHAGPAIGVVASKIIALAIGGFCLYTNRTRAFRWITYFSAVLVAWNLLVILSATNAR